jgi:Domain of unknown function (DUF4157)
MARDHARRRLAARRSEAAALLGPGRPLDRRTSRRMEALLGHDLDGVRVHDDEQAAFAARALGARGFALGRDVVLGVRDERLLAHELAHVVQQERRGASGDPEAGARFAERGRHVSASALGAAPPGLYADDEERRPKTTEPAFRLDWERFARAGRFSLGVPPLTLGPPPVLLPPPVVAGGPVTPPLTLSPPSPAAQPTGPTSAPSRLSVASSGSFSLGLRLGFPEPEAKAIPGAPASALTESLRRGQILNQIVTGQVPRGWEAIDKAQLAGAVWGIFSTHIAPDLARKITSSVSGSTGAGGPSYELDLVLFTDFSGGGLSFSVAY